MTNLANAKQIDRLCSFWPQPAVEPETMRAYGEAVASQHPDDVRRAVDDFIFGRVPGRSAEFIPPPGAVAARIIVRRNERLDEEQRNRPRIAPPIHSGDLTAEQRKQIVAEMRAAGKIRTPGKDRGPTDAEHLAAIKRTIAEAQGIETAELDAMIASLPDRQPATQRSAAA